MFFVNLCFGVRRGILWIGWTHPDRKRAKASRNPSWVSLEHETTTRDTRSQQNIIRRARKASRRFPNKGKISPVKTPATTQCSGIYRRTGWGAWPNESLRDGDNVRMLFWAECRTLRQNVESEVRRPPHRTGNNAIHNQPPVHGSDALLGAPGGCFPLQFSPKSSDDNDVGFVISTQLFWRAQVTTTP